MSALMLFDRHADRTCLKIPQLSRNATAALQTAATTQWELWDPIPCLVLLGEPASGKSFELQHQFGLAKVSRRVAFLSRWKDWMVGQSLFDLLDDVTLFFSSLEAGTQVWWFLDGLDEGKVKAERAFDALQAALTELNKRTLLHPLRLRLSCRSRDWRLADMHKLAPLFRFSRSGSDALEGIVTVQLQPLDDAAIRSLALQKLGAPDQVNHFMGHLSTANLAVLAAQPLLLAMVLDLYKEGNAAFAGDRCLLYDAAVSRLLAEHNVEHQDRQGRVTTPASRLTIAQQLAAHETFEGMDQIGLPDADNVGHHTLDASCTGAKPDELRETLATSLFYGTVGSGSTFLHRSFQEFLAAKELNQLLVEGLPLSRIIPLFVTHQGTIPGALRETAAWLSSLHGPFRDWLIKLDPLTATQAETRRYTPSQKEALIRGLSERFSRRNWQREIDKFGEIANSVSTSLLEGLLDKSKSVAVREMAVEMIYSANVAALFPKLEQLASDPTEAKEVRRAAAEALTTRSAPTYTTAMIGLLNLSENEDPDDEIAGTVLRGLYPKHITTTQALLALRAARVPNLLGYFRYFWEHQFLDRMPDSRADRQSTLDALMPLLPAAQHHFELRALTELFGSLLIAEIEAPSCQITQVGPWLGMLWTVHQFVGGPSESVVERIRATIKSRPHLREELLRWRLATWPAGVMFVPYAHAPFVEDLDGRKEFPFWLEACRKYHAQANISDWSFQHLVTIALGNLDEDFFTPIEQLCTNYPVFTTAWASNLSCPIDAQAGKNWRDQRKYKEQRAADEEALKSSVLKHLESIRAGDLNVLAGVTSTVPLDAFGGAPVELLEVRYGTTVSAAVREGIGKAWDTLRNTDWLWPISTGLPGMALVLDMGLLQTYPDLVPRNGLTDAQSDYAIWRYIHEPAKSGDLLNYVWVNHRDNTWQRLRDRLQAEAKLPDKEYATLWGHFSRAETLSPGLAEALVDLLLGEGLPLYFSSRIRALSIGLATHRDDFQSLVNQTLNCEWAVGTTLSDDEERAAMATLAAAWIVDAARVTLRLTSILNGPRHQARAASFVDALQSLFGSDITLNARWSSAVAWKDYAELLPMLYSAPVAPTTLTRGGWVSPLHQFGMARDSLVNYLTRAPIDQAEVWFGLWKDDLRFGVHCDWFATIYADIVRRRADESWVPVKRDTLKRVLKGVAALVQSDSDFSLLLNETIHDKLAPAFRSDFSLVNTLFTGTKGRRRRKDEKALQTAVYGQLMPFLSGQRLIGAREPEVLDAKKPDQRLSTILANSGQAVDVPFEVKWATHEDLWTAPKDQLVAKYMTSHMVRFGIYIVGWVGPGKMRIPRGPFGKAPDDPELLEQQLQRHVNAQFAGTDKHIHVHILNASPPPD